MKFRKKPVVIEAIQWNGENANEVGLTLRCDRPFEVVEDKQWQTRCLNIITLEGEMTARINDWIIRGIAGEFYPCKPDIFEATYEAVE